MSASWYQEVERVYQLFDTLLACELPNLIYNGEPITHWKVLETFLYGKFAHVNPAHRETLKQWRALPDLYGEVLLDFVSTVTFMSGEMVPIVVASKQELSLDA
jgi:hypothetical protein